MKKINLLVISTRRYPDTGGAAKQVYLQSKFLSNLNVNVFLMTCKPLNTRRKKIRKINNSFQIHTLPFEAPGLKTNRLKVIYFFLKFMVFGLIKSISLVKQNNINLVHAHSPPPSGLVAYLLKKIFNLNYYYTLHGLDIPYILQLDLSITAKNPEKTLVVRNEIEDTLKKRYNIPNSKFLPNGIQLDEYYHVFENRHRKKVIDRLNLENILSDDDKIISYIGYTIFHQKVEGMIDFLKGFSEFLHSIESITLRKKFKLLYIGDGKFSARLVKAIKNSNLEGNVFFLGERNDIKHILAISDLLALTSYTEGFSMALLETMASSVPVIASKVGENKYIVNKTGFLVTPGNYLQIAEKLSNYFDLPDSKIRYYQIKAQERIKNNFDIKIIVKKLLNQIYSS